MHPISNNEKQTPSRSKGLTGSDNLPRNGSVILGFLLGVGIVVIGAGCLYVGMNFVSLANKFAMPGKEPAQTQRNEEQLMAMAPPGASAAVVPPAKVADEDPELNKSGRRNEFTANPTTTNNSNPQIYFMMGGQGGQPYANTTAFYTQPLAPVLPTLPALPAMPILPGMGGVAGIPALPVLPTAQASAVQVPPFMLPNPQIELNNFIMAKYQQEFTEYMRQKTLQAPAFAPAQLPGGGQIWYGVADPSQPNQLHPAALQRNFVDSDIAVPEKITVDLKRRFSRNQKIEDWLREEKITAMAAAEEVRKETPPNPGGNPSAPLRPGLSPAGEPSSGETAPDIDAVLRQLAETTFGGKQYERTARVYAELASRGVNLSITELMRWAKASELAGDPDSAIRILDLILKIDPNNVLVLKEAAQLEVSNDKFSSAAEYYGRLMKLQPDVRDWRMWRAKTLTWSDRGREAIDLMRELHREDPTDMELNIMLADLLLSLHEFAESIPLLDLLIAHDSKDDTLRVRKMNALMALKRFREAADIAGDLLTRYPEDTELILKQAVSYVAAGAFKEAVVPFQKYLALKPDDLEVRKQFAEDLMAAQMFPAAADQYQRILVQEPGNHEIRKKLANAYMAYESYAEAATVYEELVMVFPNDAELNLGLVVSLRLSHQLQAAFDAAKAYMQIDGYDPRILKQAAGLAMELGDTKHGQEWYRRAIRLDSSDFESRIALGKSLIGDMKYEEAENEFRRALAFSEDNEEARRGLARALFYQRKYKEAFPVYQKLAWEYPDSAYRLEMEYREAVASGKEIEAAAVLAQLQEVEPEDMSWKSDRFQGLLRQHRFPEARAQAKINVQQDPQHRATIAGYNNMNFYLSTWPITLRGGYLRKTSIQGEITDENFDEQDRKAKLTYTYIGLHGEKSLGDFWRAYADLDRESWNLREEDVDNPASYRFRLGGIFEGNPFITFKGDLGFRWFTGSEKQVKDERRSIDNQWLYNVSAEMKEIAGSNLNLLLFSDRREHYDNYFNVYDNLYAYDFGLIPHYRYRKWDFQGELVSSVLTDANTRLYAHADAKYRLYETPCMLITLGGNIEYETWNDQKPTYYSPKDMYKYGVDFDGRYYYCRDPEVWNSCEGYVDFGLSIYRDRYGSTGQKFYAGIKHDYTRRLSAFARVDLTRETYYSEIKLLAGLTYAFGGCK